jgi:hypothetical protein
MIVSLIGNSPNLREINAKDCDQITRFFLDWTMLCMQHILSQLVPFRDLNKLHAALNVRPPFFYKKLRAVLVAHSGNHLNKFYGRHRFLIYKIF